MTEKGREYAATTTRKAAIFHEKEFRRKLYALNALSAESRNQDEIKDELQAMSSLVNNTLDKFTAWTNLAEDPVECRSIADMRSFVQNTRDNAQKAAWHRIRVLDDEEARSTLSSLSHGSGRSRRSTGSNLSPKETLVNIKAKRAGLQQKLRFCETVREQEKTLEKLKLEQEFSETVAEEEVYETAAHEDESQLPSPRPPLESLDVLNYYLQDEGAPRRSPIITTSPLATHPTSVQHRPAASRAPTPPTSPVSSASPNTAVDIPPGNAQPRDESANTTFTFPQPRPAETPRPAAEILTSIQPKKENTSATFILAQPRPAVLPTSTAETCPHTAGTPDVGASVFIPMRAQPSADNAQQIVETLTKVTQLQRLPQANPDVYRGDEKDKTRFFLWETAFDSLVDSAPVSAQQKLHLLYQHLDSKAKKVVEQLQYMIGDPGKAYQEARKKLKERFGHPALLSVEFENKLSSWPKIGNNDAEGMQEFGDFLQQVEIASQYISNLKIFEFPYKLQSLVEKLPGWFKSKWSNKVQKLQQTEGHDAFPSFSDFVAEVTFHAERMNIPQIAHATPDPKGVGSSYPSPAYVPARRRTKGSSATTLASKTTRPQGAASSHGTAQKEGATLSGSSHNQQGSSTAREVFCPFHKTRTHTLNECHKFQELDFSDRKDFLFKNRVCFNCANSNQHVAKVCKEGQPECAICRKDHVTVLHEPTGHDSNNESSSDRSTSACIQICGIGMPSRSCARIVLVKAHHQSDPSPETVTLLCWTTSPLTSSSQIRSWTSWL